MNSTGAYQTLAYDHRNRLTGVSQFTSADVFQSTIAYQYDTLDHMVERAKTVPDTSGGEGNDTITSREKFVYAGASALRRRLQPCALPLAGIESMR